MRPRRTALLVALLLLAVMAAACVPAADPPVVATPSTTATAGQPVSGGGTFRYGIGEPTAIVPTGAATADDRAVVDAVFDSLTTWGPAGEALPAAAVRWTSSQDSGRWTFDLRPGATFHDGTPVTAAHFRDAWSVLLATGGPAAYLLSDVVGHGAVVRGDVPVLAGVRVVDDLTLEVALSRPRADLPVVVGHPALGPVRDAALLAAAGAPAAGTTDRPSPDVDAVAGPPRRQSSAAGIAPEDAAVLMPVGNGPFEVTEPWQRGDFIRAAAWPGWRNGDRPRDGIAEVLFRIGDLDINYLAFTQGRRDFTEVPIDALPLAEEAHPPRGGAWDGPGLIRGGRPETYVLAIDRRVPPYDQRTVREAVSLILDRAAIAEDILGGNLVPSTSLLPSSLPGARLDTCDLCTFNPSAAAERLADAGVTRLTFSYNAGGGHERIRNALRAALSAIGVSLVSNGRAPAPPLPEYQQLLAAGGVGLFRLPLVADVPSSLALLHPLLHSDMVPAAGGLNHMGYDDPTVDALLDQAARTTDDRTREALVRRAADIAVNRDTVVIPVFEYQHAFVAGEGVRNLRYGPFGLLNLTEVVLVA